MADDETPVEVEYVVSTPQKVEQGEYLSDIGICTLG